MTHELQPSCALSTVPTVEWLDWSRVGASTVGPTSMVASPSCYIRLSSINNHFVILFEPRILHWRREYHQNAPRYHTDQLFGTLDAVKNELLHCTQQAYQPTRRLPHNSPALVVRKKCLSQAASTFWLPMHMPLLSLYQDLVDAAAGLCWFGSASCIGRTR